MTIKKCILAAAVIAMGIVASGCTDHRQLKQELLSAAGKQSDIKSYRFEGGADLALQPSVKDTDPLTATLAALLKESSVTWKGVFGPEPRFEADLSVTPKGAAAPLELVAILSDKKWYFSLPPVTKKDEFVSVDMTKLKGGSQELSGQWISAWEKQLLDAMDAKFIDKAKERVTLQDNTTAALYTIEMTDKNEKELLGSFQAALPALAELVKSGGLNGVSFAPDSMVPHKPSRLTFAVDEQGYIREQKLSLYFTVKGQDGRSGEHHIELRQYVSDINRPQSFQKPVPANAKPFEDVVKLPAPAKK